MGFAFGLGCGCCCGWVINVNGCLGTGLPGFTVDLSQSGTPVASATTGDGTGGTTLGQVRFTVPLGTYDVTITPISGSGFATYTGSIAFSCTTTDMVSNITMTADTGYVCVPCCNYPVATTLQTTDGLGAHSMVYLGLIGTTVHRWQLTTTYTTTAYQTNNSPPPSCLVSNTFTPLRYTLDCTVATGTWSFIVSFGAVACTGGPLYAYFPFSPVPNAGSPSTLLSASCFPFSLSFNTPSTITFGGGPIAVPGGGGTMGVTP